MIFFILGFFSATILCLSFIILDKKIYILKENDVVIKRTDLQKFHDIYNKILRRYDPEIDDEFSKE